MTIEELRELFAYNDWANARIFESLATVTDDEWGRELGGSFASLRGTAAHLVGAEWLWLRRWKGETPEMLPAWLDHPTVSTLREELERVESERNGWLAGLRDGDLTSPCAYRFQSGERHVTPYGMLLSHLVNHSSYHRGQLVTLMRQAGRTPLNTDLLVWDFRRHET